MCVCWCNSYLILQLEYIAIESSIIYFMIIFFLDRE